MGVVVLSAFTDMAGVLINGGLLVVAIVALLFAGWQACAAKNANELTRLAQRRAAQQEELAARQAIEDSRRATRPYVWVEAVPSLAGAPCWDLVLRNTGRTPARGLSLQTAWPRPADTVTERLEKAFVRPFDLMPGASLRVLWRTATPTDIPGRRDQPAGMPAACRITVSYRGDDPDVGAFTEETFLDGPTRGELYPKPQEGAHPATQAEPLKALYEIDGALRALNGHVGELRR